jgi:hypothetical protein
MIKSIIALAAGALFSMNAFAGYVKYDLNGPLSGSIIQHDTDKSIAYFNFDLYIDGVGRPFRLPLTPQLGDGTTQLTYATTSFRGQGPTNFGIYSNFGADQFTNVGVTFSQNDSGVFSYVANYTSSIFFIGGFQNFAGQHIGSATVGVVNPLFAAELDRTGGYYETMTSRIVPTFVPEPGSIALLAVGAIGLLNMRRRRKA